MKDGIIVSKRSKQTSTPWFKTRKGLRVKLTTRVTETITCTKIEDDLGGIDSLGSDKVRAMRIMLGEE